MQKSDFEVPDFKNELTSDFNEAKYQIYRLHELLTKCHAYSQRGDLFKLKWVLDRIWVELAADARAKGGKKEKELEENPYFARVEELNKDITKAGSNREKLYKALQQKEIYLRFLQDDVGKGGKRSPSDEDEFD